MRARELILLEYRREVTLQKIGDRLQQAAQRDTRQSAEEVIAQLEKIDPTANKQYTLWLAQNYIQSLFRLEDADRVRDVLTKFIQVKSRLEQKDINRYTFHTLEDKIDSIFNVQLNQPDQTQATTPAADEGIFPVVPGSKILYNGVLGQLSIPETLQANKVLCSGTKWCTSDVSTFKGYSKAGPLYIWRDKNGEKYQFHFSENVEDPYIQLMDSRDRKISPELFRYFRNEHPVLKHFFQNYESKLLKSGGAGLINYAEYYGGRWPELEEKIKDNPRSVIEYAIHILRKRWIKAEPMLLQQANAEEIYDYIVRFFNKGLGDSRSGWPTAEAKLAESDNPRYMIQYARSIVGKRLPQYEPKILEQIKKLITKKKISQDDVANLLYFSQYVKHLAPDWEEGRAVFPTLKKLINVGGDRDLLKLPDLPTLREGKVKLYTDPDYFGAEVDDTGFDSLPVVNISVNKLVGFEPDSKMSQPKSQSNVEKIVAGLKKGDRLPPILVRKYRDGYQVLDGHHRFWAYKSLGIKSIPSRIVPDSDIEEIGKQDVTENFADGRNPGRRGLSRRVGIPKKATLGQLEKIAKSSTGERRRMAQWQLNMRRGRNKQK